MRGRRSNWWEDEARGVDARGIAPLEHELTMHLERAYELAERAQLSNDKAQHEIDRARQIADDLLIHVREQK
jgi:hypothetical protein